MTVDMIMQSPGTALYPELNPSYEHLHEDEKALQIALELSNLGLLGINDDDLATYDDIAKGKRSQNMTECVPVPSSEHVAEIVGRQGCKIKALRAKTNTYIKTPVRGEDPVFVVTGRKEDVAMARREVQSAAEHFTQIRASRNRHALLASQALGAMNADGTAGTITLQVRVPYRVVGLVVGPKGATIKRIQQQTHTYIVTPSRDKEPVFEVTGLPENVERAKEEIEAHIASRTGSQQTSIDDDFRNNGTDVEGPCSQSEYAKMTISSSSQFVPPTSINTSVLRPAATSFFPLSTSTQQTYPCIPSTQTSPVMAATSSDVMCIAGDRQFHLNSGLSHHANGSYSSPDTQNPNLSWNMGPKNKLELPISSVTRPSSYLPLSSSGLNQNLASTQLHNRSSPTLSDKEFNSFPNILLPPSTQSMHLPVRRVASEESSTSSAPSLEFGNLLTPSSTPAVNIESGYSSSGTADSITSGSPDSVMGHLQFQRDCFPSKPQRCVLCSESPVSAALVPCGHHLFCYDCAKDLVSKKPALCPCCHVNASRALLIKQ